MELLISAKELAEKCGVSRACIYLWLKKGIPYLTKQRGLNHEVYFDPIQADEWISKNTNKNQWGKHQQKTAVTGQDKG